MKHHFEAATAQFPTDFHNGYWHLHIPVAQAFISSSKTPWKVQQNCMQLLLLRAAYLQKLKPEDQIQYRVVVAIDAKDLWGSQIIIFQGNEYFSSFFQRDNTEQKWQLVNEKKSIQQQWNLRIPKFFEIAGYKDSQYENGEVVYEGELWFFGELTL